MVLRHSVGEYVAAFFSKACLFRQAFFLYMSGAVRLGLGSPSYLLKPVFFKTGFFLCMSGAVRLGLGSPPFFSEACLFQDRLFFVYERRSSAYASGRRFFFY